MSVKGEAQHDPLFPVANALIRSLLWALVGGATVYVLAVFKVLPIIGLAVGE